MTENEQFVDDNMIMFLEPEQFVGNASEPIPRASLSRRTRLGLWALRVFVTSLTIMVIYAFVGQLK
jgi:hypothetical protein